MKILSEEVGPIQTNCYIVWDEETMEGVVFDPGADAKSIYAIIDEHKIHVKYILLTHTHYDHTGGVKELYELLNEEAIIAVHKDEYHAFLSDERNHSEKLFFKNQLELASESISVGNIIFDLIIVPGHTVASVCFYSAKEHLLIAGDTLFYHTIGTNRTYNGPSMDLVHNITSSLLVLPDETIVYPGHGPSTSILEERTKNPYLSDSDTIDPWL